MSILNGIQAITREFKRIGLEQPEVILLRSHEEGLKFHASLIYEMGGPSHFVIDHGKQGPTVVEHPDGSVWIECKVIGTKVRWPAQRLALEDGGFKWI